jgi:hypothetical protein
MTYLYAAYAATWAIHILYLGYLVGQYTKLRKDIREVRLRK